MLRHCCRLGLALAVILAVSSAAEARKQVIRQRVITGVGPEIASTPPVVPLGVSRPEVQQGEHFIDNGITNPRALVGGGRHLSRHECEGFPLSLEATYSRDVGLPARQLFSGLSNDNGETWALAGPLSAFPDEFSDRDQSVAFGTTTYIVYTEEGFPGGLRSIWATQDILACLQAFNAPARATPDAGRNEIFVRVEVTQVGGSDVLYISWQDQNATAGGNPRDVYFQKSTDGGATWSDPLYINAAANATSFPMLGLDGPLSMAANGDEIWAYTTAYMDTAWATANGWDNTQVYPCWTHSTDGGVTWDPIALFFGTDGNAVPGGHTADPDLNSKIQYDGGVLDVGYAGFNNVFENCTLDAGGNPHFGFEMGWRLALPESTFVFADVENMWEAHFDGSGNVVLNFAGFPEDTSFSTDTSGVVFYTNITRTTRGDIVASWQELGQVSTNVDIWAWAHTVSGTTVKQNMTNSAKNEQMTRVADVFVPTGGLEGEFYADYLYLNSVDGGNGTGGFVTTDSSLWHFQTTIDLDPAVGVGGDTPTAPPLPAATALAQNFPNPFNPSTTLPFDLAAAADVRLVVFNLRGEQVRELVHEGMGAGRYAIPWDGRDGSGRLVPSGIYIYRLSVDGGYRATRKMVLLK